MTAGEQSRENHFEHRVLPDDDFLDLIEQLLQDLGVILA